MLSRYLDLDILHIVQTSSGSCCNRIFSTSISDIDINIDTDADSESDDEEYVQN